MQLRILDTAVAGTTPARVHAGMGGACVVLSQQCASLLHVRRGVLDCSRIAMPPCIAAAPLQPLADLAAYIVAGDGRLSIITLAEVC